MFEVPRRDDRTRPAAFCHENMVQLVATLWQSPNKKQNINTDFDLPPGWWLGPLKNMSQLGWLDTQHFWENKSDVPNHQPATVIGVGLMYLFRPVPDLDRGFVRAKVCWDEPSDWEASPAMFGVGHPWAQLVELFKFSRLLVPFKSLVFRQFVLDENFDPFPLRRNIPLMGPRNETSDTEPGFPRGIHR